MAGSAARVRDLNELASVWRRRGLRVLEMPGWQDRGRESGNTFEVLGCHHTAAAQDIDRILRDGRADLPGPLCNVALHANGDVVLVASGRANHFGVATWPSSRALGVEATGPPFTNYAQYVQLAAGFCEWKWQPTPNRVIRNDTTIPVYLVAAHKEVAVPYGRKPNPAGFGFNNGGRTIAGVTLIDDFRSDVAAALAGQQEEDEHMSAADVQELKDYITQLLRRVDHGDGTEASGDVGRVDDNDHASIRRDLQAIAARVTAIESGVDALVARPQP
jgi:hypothetical protein